MERESSSREDTARSETDCSPASCERLKRKARACGTGAIADVFETALAVLKAEASAQSSGSADVQAEPLAFGLPWIWLGFGGF